MWQTGFCILACLWACACDPPDNDTIVLEPAGHSLEWLEPGHEAPVCRILGALGERRRGVLVDVTRSAGAEDARWIVGAPRIETDYDCADAGPLHDAPLSALDGCRAEREGQDVCLVELDVLLDEVDARFDQLPASERGALVLRLNPGDVDDPGRLSAMVDALVERLLVFEYAEQIYLASWRPELLEPLVERLDSALVSEVRTALIVRDRAGTVGGRHDAVEIDTAWDLGLDLIFVPARAVDDIIDDASRMALESGGVAVAVYDADDPTVYRRIVQHPGLDLVVGALGETLAGDWGVDDAAAFDCRGFLQSRATLASFLPVTGQANACPVF